MKLVSRVVAVGAVAALTLGTPTAAFAGGKANTAAKGKAAAAQKIQKSKAAEARKKVEAARKKAEEARKKKAAEARARFTFPGTVTAVSVDGKTVTISRKVRGVVVNQEFVLAPDAQVKRDGARGAMPVVGDHAVAKGTRKGDVLVVSWLNSSAPEVVEAPAAAPAPAPADGSTVAPGTIPSTPTTEAKVGQDGTLQL